MGIKFSSFALRGVDVSSYNGTIDWSKVDGQFVIIRAGYGRRGKLFLQLHQTI